MSPVLVANSEGRAGVEPARSLLERGGSALDAVEQGIRPVEADLSVRTVGLGGAPDLVGNMEFDAAVMDGRARKAGAVAALRDRLHAISVARQILERLPRVMLVGQGAARFADEIGMKSEPMLTDQARATHDRWLGDHIRAEDREDWPDVPLASYAWASSKDYTRTGTTAFMAVDVKGDVAVGTSTSGWARCYPGRVGDTPIIGAGLYADNRHGACVCTGVGEMTIRTGTARTVVASLKAGARVRDACADAMTDLAGLDEGVLGPVVVHAIDTAGACAVLCNLEIGRDSSWYFWAEGMAEAELRQAEVFSGR
jgi:beta-aspartyl-peptidase (threonine type)